MNKISLRHTCVFACPNKPVPNPDCCVVLVFVPKIGWIVLPKGFAACVVPKGLAVWDVLPNPKVPVLLVGAPKPAGLPNRPPGCCGWFPRPKPVVFCPKFVVVWPKPVVCPKADFEASVWPNNEGVDVTAPPNGVVPKPGCCCGPKIWFTLILIHTK